MPNYFLYARKSTDVEDKQVRSIDDQLAVLRALAKTEGLNISEEFIEKQSAKMPGRPVFDEMLARVEKGEAEGGRLDRFGSKPQRGASDESSDSKRCGGNSAAPERPASGAINSDKVSLVRREGNRTAL